MLIRKGVAAMLSCVSWSSSSAAAGPEPQPAKSGVDNLLGVTFDTGRGEDRVGASAAGARFTQMHLFPTGVPVAGWLGYGIDARAITLGFDSLDASLAHLVVRAGFATHAGVGCELEGAIGTAFDGSFVPIYAVGALFAPAPFFGFGVSTQEPLFAARPGWLEKMQWSARVMLPLDP